jgi:hypothetical protein
MLLIPPVYFIQSLVVFAIVLPIKHIKNTAGCQGKGARLHRFVKMKQTKVK